MIGWAIYLSLVPFYIFTSGLPQPSDVFVLMLFPVVLRGWNRRLSPTVGKAARALFGFTAWVVIVNYSWAAVTGKWSLFGTDAFILYPLYYIYNVILFMIAVILYQRYGERFLRLTLAMVYATVIFQVLASFILISGGRRGSLFFNNPNQLGYFSLIAACIVVLLHWRLKLRLLTSGAVIACCGYLSAISASRSALGGIALLLALLVFSNPRAILGVGVAAVLLLSAGGPIASVIDNAESRVLNRRSNQSFAEERGYDRILQHSDYLILGAGEGGLSRFSDEGMFHKELHSSFGTVVFSYGIIGTFFFGLFLYRMLRHSGFRLGSVMLPLGFYAIAHQGLRFTLLWVLFAIFVALQAERSTSRRQRSVGMMMRTSAT